jgi:hypothetical protein
MKEELISFNVAKLAKEKGFDVLTKLRYREDGSYGTIFKKGAQIMIPTQALLQKWLREVHNIDVFCDCIGSRLYYSVIYDNSVKQGNDKVFEQDKETSYEEALEIGLQEALKLI